ncbi:hypothetical protein EV714DRAFT_276413 [Schizophyllum commune]
MLSKHASSNACDIQADALETLDCALAHLEVRDELDSSSESQTELSSPVDRVPTELWKDIFLCACADTILAYPLRADMLTARTLGQICQRWRDIALDDTRLWVVFIYIDMDQLMRHVDDVRVFCATVTLYLARSGDQSFSLEIYWGCRTQSGSFPHGLQDERLSDVRLLLSDLVQNIWRWQDCAVSANILEYISRNLFRNDFPRRLENCHILDPTADDIDRALFSFAPCLRSWRQEAGSYWPKLPLRQLTQIKTGFVPVSALAEILSNCEALEDLEADVQNCLPGDIRFPTSVSLPNLWMVLLTPRAAPFITASISIGV